MGGTLLFDTSTSGTGAVVTGALTLAGTATMMAGFANMIGACTGTDPSQLQLMENVSNPGGMISVVLTGVIGGLTGNNVSPAQAASAGALAFDVAAALYDMTHPAESAAQAAVQALAGQSQTGADIVATITKDCHDFGTCSSSSSSSQNAGAGDGGDVGAGNAGDGGGDAGGNTGGGGGRSESETRQEEE